MLSERVGRLRWLLLGLLTSAIVGLERPTPAGAQEAIPSHQQLICQYNDWDCAKAYRVMICESTANPNAYNVGQYGLFQIAYRYHAEKVENANDLFNPAINIQVAHRIWQEEGWGPWPACGLR